MFLPSLLLIIFLISTQALPAKDLISMFGLSETFLLFLGGLSGFVVVVFSCCYCFGLFLNRGFEEVK